MSSGGDRWLLFRVGRRRCALPIRFTLETMRPLPIRAVGASQRAVLGVATIRGSMVPVVDVAALFGEGGGEPRRFVTVKVGERVVALAVDDVIGVETIAASAWDALPALLSAGVSDVVDAIASADRDLVLALSAGRLMPDEAA